MWPQRRKKTSLGKERMEGPSEAQGRSSYPLVLSVPPRSPGPKLGLCTPSAYLSVLFIVWNEMLVTCCELALFQVQEA
jgi:hypothetical protein